VDESLIPVQVLDKTSAKVGSVDDESSSNNHSVNLSIKASSADEQYQNCFQIVFDSPVLPQE